MQEHHSNQHQTRTSVANSNKEELTAKIFERDGNYLSSSERKDDIKMEVIYKEKDLNIDSCGSSEEFEVEMQGIPMETSEFKRKSRPLSAGNNAKSDPVFDATLSLSNGKVRTRNAWASIDDVNDSQHGKPNATKDSTSARNEVQRPKIFENSESLCSSDEENVSVVPINYPPSKSEKMPNTEEIETHKACNDAIMCKATKDYRPSNERYLSFSKGKCIEVFKFLRRKLLFKTSFRPVIFIKMTFREFVNIFSIQIPTSQRSSYLNRSFFLYFLQEIQYTVNLSMMKVTSDLDLKKEISPGDELKVSLTCRTLSPWRKESKPQIIKKKLVLEIKFSSNKKQNCFTVS